MPQAETIVSAVIAPTITSSGRCGRVCSVRVGAEPAAGEEISEATMPRNYESAASGRIPPPGHSHPLPQYRTRDDGPPTGASTTKARRRARLRAVP
ncbi:hypothetical protein FMUBM48_33540 [Nocardia cyriacigeorgica]|nr:hypothetical protein FMUBM48_33540 [Nocardia cyriacigeorgica]